MHRAVSFNVEIVVFKTFRRETFVKTLEFRKDLNDVTVSEFYELARAATREECDPSDCQWFGLSKGDVEIDEAKCGSEGLHRYIHYVPGKWILRVKGDVEPRGGTVPFPDVSAEPEIIPFSPSAPRWRGVCHGLSLEGTCTNEQCEAHGKKVIMPNFKYRSSFSFTEDVHEDECKCPICKEFVNPTNCYFYDCQYRFNGSKKPTPQSRPIPFTSDWTTADEDKKAVTWDPKRRMTNWCWLMVHTRRIQECDRCFLCLEKLRGPDARDMAVVELQECRHQVHGLCLSQMTDNQKCPFCLS